MSHAWKDHERKVAKYFRTTRRLRGDDFSQSDIEVLASVDTWLGWTGSGSFIVVECKHTKKNGIVNTFRNIASQYVNKDRIPILRIGNFLLCYLENFDEIFVDFIYNDNCNPDLVDISSKYSFLYKDLKEPKYLRDYREQVLGYSSHVPTKSKCLPITCLARPSTVGRIVSIHIEDLEYYRHLCLTPLSSEQP